MPASARRSPTRILISVDFPRTVLADEADDLALLEGDLRSGQDLHPIAWRPQVSSVGLLDPGCGENQSVGAQFLVGCVRSGNISGGQVLHGATSSS